MIAITTMTMVCVYGTWSYMIDVTDRLSSV